MRTTAGELAYEDLGSGPAVVLLHANLHDHHDFDPIIPALAADHRVIAVDWPGHGASAPNPTLTAAACATALVDLVTTLNLNPAVFLGNSLGGYAAASLALTHPERVAGLILVNTGGFVPQTPLTRAYCTLYGSTLAARYWLPHSIRNYTKPMSPHDNAIIARTTRVARTDIGRTTYSSLWHSFNSPTYDLTPRASQITTPTLIIWGTRDPVLPLRYAHLTHRLLPHSTLHLLPTGHLPFSSTPNQFLELAEPFIQSSLAAAGTER
ncbi:alpha/beta hydrolase [Nocardia sp. CDC153]|uniref:alpha/beta fold hydrolase n=1 Tax=Nocardia sp. CDC153 TaxID=3112167 RepID=UPI002DBC522C|nr:alpha/beta hydrolase [Nocardia sp. CDC153]MEC3953313.1 alpha/beta hydrolase [Nocardia sp. CDC153]